MKILLPLLAAALTAGCATGPSPEELANADYGTAPTAAYKVQIKNHFHKLLIDPDSARYTYTEPVKGNMMNYSSYKYEFGWKVCGYVNSKNRMGGYSGGAPYAVLFQNGKIINYDLGTSENKMPDQNIANSCNQPF